jgi:hypothetical protein
MAKLRCSGGVKMSHFYGGFSNQVDLVNFPVFAIDQTLTVAMSVEQPITTKKVLLQLGVIYICENSDRRVRVFSFEVPVSSDISAVINSIDIPACASVLVRKQIAALKGNVAFDRDLVFFASAGGLPYQSFFRLVYAFRGLFAGLSSDGQVALGRWTAMCPLAELILMLYPRMFAIDQQTDALPCCADSFRFGWVFLFHCWHRIYIWISERADAKFVANAFGTDFSELAKLPTLENQLVWDRVQNCLEISGKYLPVEIIKQGDEREGVIRLILIDRPDQGPTFNEWFESQIKLGARSRF